jgi:hypothetical protein
VSALPPALGASVQRPRFSTHKNQEEKGAEHREISARVADHEPEALIRAEKLGNLRGGNGGRDHDQERNRRGACPQAKQNQQATNNLESSYKMGREIR